MNPLNDLLGSLLLLLVGVCGGALTMFWIAGHFWLNPLELRLASMRVFINRLCDELARLQRTPPAQRLDVHHHDEAARDADWWKKDQEDEEGDDGRGK